jgi:hypothetical protein
MAVLAAEIPSLAVAAAVVVAPTLRVILAVASDPSPALGASPAVAAPIPWVAVPSPEDLPTDPTPAPAFLTQITPWVQDSLIVTADPALLGGGRLAVAQRRSCSAIISSFWPAANRASMRASRCTTLVEAATIDRGYALP